MNKIGGSHESTLVLKKGKKLRKIKGTHESTLVLEIGKSLGKIGVVILVIKETKI